MARAVKQLQRVAGLMAAIFAAVSPAFLLKAQDAAPAWQAAMREPRSLALIPFFDPWPDSKPRWLDIDDGRFHAFINTLGTPDEFVYRVGQVVLTYDFRQNGGVFRGHIEARGLKPNFAYQLKLCGKPMSGVRGWGRFGDDKSNAALGFQGRWWDDSDQKGGFDDYYRSLYVKAAPPRRHSMVGYVFIGDFVTDEAGSAGTDFVADTPLHITWQDKQKVPFKHHEAGVWAIQSTQKPFRGYGSAFAPRTIKLWYEHEKGRPGHLKLPAGRYNCRLLVTEESFHSKTTAGGRWLTVLATEDFHEGQPDSDPANDLVFQMANEGAV